MNNLSVKTFHVRIVDAGFRLLRDAVVRAHSAGQGSVKLERREDRWVGQSAAGEKVTLEVSASGFESETHSILLRDEVTQAVIGLRRAGEISYSYGSDRLAFSPTENAFLIHVRGDKAGEIFPKAAKKLELKWQSAAPLRAKASDDLFLQVEGNMEQAGELSKALLRAKLNAEISRVIGHGDRLPLGLTKELVVRFHDSVKHQEAERLAASLGLKIIRSVHHAGNAFVLAQEGEPSYDILKAADALASDSRVVYAEPNLTFVIEPDQYTPNDPLWGQVPHLQLIDADDAWDLLDNVATDLRGGSPTITIAVIDLDGVAPNHSELTANLTDGTSKLLTSINFAVSPIAIQTVAGLGGDHGTKCAGSATAAFDDNRGIPGVAPNCHLIGARIAGATNSVLMADIYLWVAGFMNGSMSAGFPAAPPAQAADVISSSWGSSGLALSNTIRDCFDFLTTYGRSGKGCVLCFSLGNSGYGDFTDPLDWRFRAWPAYEKTLGIGSSINVNPTDPVPSSCHADPGGLTNNISAAVDTRSLFSPYGAAALRKPDLVAPSHTAYQAPCPPGTLIDPVLSTVLPGTGAVDGCPGAAVCNDYDYTFGGTSHSTPVVAGAVALILSARPNLNWVQVRDLLWQSCSRIDSAQTNAVGQWQDLDGDGLIDYSRWYGAGRLDAGDAVELALEETLPLADIYVRENLSDSGTVPSGGAWYESPDIWVRQDATTPIPTLAWTDPAPHQNARRGQDNAVFCRVRNRGTAAATVVYVRAMVTHWAGLEFVYPADFQPSNNVGSPIPNPLVPGTYLIGEERIDNLAPGADQIVKFNWPQALIPPESVTMSGAPVHWHPCLLVEASPHDGPDPIGGLAIPVQGNNNIAQRNIEILDADDPDSDLFVGMIAGTRDDVGVASLVVDATRLRGATSIMLHVADDRAMKQLSSGIRRAIQNQLMPVRVGDKQLDCAVIVEERTRLRLECGPCDIVIEAAPGSRIFTGNYSAASPVTAGFVNHQNLDSVEIKGLRSQIEIPMRLSGNQFVPLLVAVTGKGTGDLRITQRRGDGEFSAGYGIRRVITGKNRG